MKLTPEQRRELLNEMELAEQFTEKRWAARFSISIATVRRLRRAQRTGDERRERLLPNLAHEIHIVCFATGSKGATKA